MRTGDFMIKEDNVKKEWNEAAESYSNFIRQGKDYYKDELNNPATFKLIGNVKGKKILDLACGEGNNARLLAKKEALVVGIDFSERLIDLARQLEIKEKLDITYHVLNAANMEKLPRNNFDLVTCFMAL